MAVVKIGLLDFEVCEENMSKDEVLRVAILGRVVSSKLILLMKIKR